MKRLKRTIPALLLAVVMLAGCAGPKEIYEGISNGDYSVSESMENIKDRLTGKKEEKKSGCGLWEKLLEKIEEIFGKEKDGRDANAEYEKNRAERIVKFSEMEYSRPDSGDLRRHLDDLKAALDEGKMKLPEIEELLELCLDDYHYFSTMESLANIRNCLDLKDEFYADEYAWISEESADISDMMDEMYYACGGSKYAKKLERDYFWDGFAEEYANEEDSIFTDRFVELNQQSANLVTEYRDLIADPKVTVDGREVSYADALGEAEKKVIASMNAFLEKQDDYGLYMEYYGDYMNYVGIISDYYSRYGTALTDMFIRVVRNRRDMAEETGFDSVEEMEYSRDFYDRDYTPEQAGEFMEAVADYIVPLKDRVVSEMNFEYPDETDYTPEKLRSCLEKVVAGMGGNFVDSYEFMNEYELCDLSAGPNKTPMSFQTYLDYYEAPFLLISPSGNIGDAMTAIHEFGHYTDAFGNYGAGEAIDLAECFSQGLELLSLNMLEDELGSDAVRYLAQDKVKDTLWTYLYQCAYAEFERGVYALDDDELTSENINNIYIDQMIRFGLIQDGYEDYVPFTWTDIPHFFESPFYVISYPVSCNVALQFFAMEMDEEGSGIEKYNEMLGHESGDLLETLEEYDMDSPFDSGNVRATANIIKKMCKAFR